jgi:hypothetical protein
MYKDFLANRCGFRLFGGIIITRSIARKQATTRMASHASPEEWSDAPAN